MLRTLLTGLALAASSAALAAPADDYVTFKTALAINEACGGLKYIEHSRTQGAAITALNATSQASHLQDGRLPQDEYDRFVSDLDARAAAQAQSVGCTQAAMQYIAAGKGRAAEEIYRSLLLAFNFEGAIDVIMHMELGADRKAAALRYDAYLQHLYGANFQAFAARQRELAIAELPVVNPFDTGFGSILISPEDSSKIRNAQSMAAYVLNEVFFEVSAEMAGYIVRPRPLAEHWTIPELRRADAPTVEGMPVVVQPRYDLVEFTAGEQALRDRLYSLIVLTPERRLRVMFYGDTAQLLTDPTVRLYVRTEELPAGANPYDYFDRAAFRDATVAFEGVAVQEPCLGAPCFDFPPEATDAFARFENMDAELFVSHLPDAEPIAEDVSYKPGQVSSFYTHKFLAEQ
jgi:hypothetical protein